MRVQAAVRLSMHSLQCDSTRRVPRPTFERKDRESSGRERKFVPEMPKYADAMLQLSVHALLGMAHLTPAFSILGSFPLRIPRERTSVGLNLLQGSVLADGQHRGAIFPHGLDTHLRPVLRTRIRSSCCGQTIHGNQEKAIPGTSGATESYILSDMIGALRPRFYKAFRW